jgi:hypothetical protein
MFITMSDDILDRYSRDNQGTAPPIADGSFTPDDIMTKYTREPQIVKEAGKPTRVIMDVSPRGDVADASGFNNRMVSDIPVVGPLFDKATAAAGAAIQPLVDDKSRSKTFGQRYEENLAFQDAKNKLYEEQHPIASAAADVTGGGLLLGPLSETGVGARMMGLTGNSLGAKVYQGAAGMGALEAADQGLKGNNPLNQGVLGAVPLAMAGGALGPMVGHGITSAADAVSNWLPRTTGELAGVNSVGRKILVNALDGETPESILEAKKRYGPSGMLADINTATTDIAGGLADIPGPHKEIVREAYRQRAAG